MAETPTYSLYGKLYKFEDLERASNLGLSDYLSGLKRGSKDEDKFREAYSNILGALRNGTLTYQDGKFVDSSGTYYNYYNATDKDKKDKNKDYYGLMANYIFGNMGKSQEYVKPEDKTKIKWNGNSSMGQALIRALYNSDSENIDAFVDLDRNDLKSSKYRAIELRNKAADIKSKFDTLFTEYTQDLRKEALGYLDSAISSLSDDSFDAGDYLALSRAFGNLNYKGMFTDGVVTQSDETTSPSSSTQASSTLPSAILLFLLFMDEYHPQHTYKDRGVLLNYKAGDSLNLSPEGKKALSDALSKLSENDFYERLNAILTAPDKYNEESFKVFGNPVPRSILAGSMLQYLKDNNKLTDYSFGESNLGAYYIPNSEIKSEGSGVVWDSNTGQVYTMDYLKIPYFRKKILEEFQTWLTRRQNGGTTQPHWLDSYGYYKEGGIIKAARGIRFSNDANWYTGVFLALKEAIKERLQKDKTYADWLNGMLDKHYNIYSSAGGASNTWQDTAYQSDDVSAYQNEYKSGRNGEFTDLSGYNQYGIVNSYNLGMFDRYGTSKRTSGDWSGTTAESSWKTDGMYSGVTDYRRLLGRVGDYTDELLEETKKFFKDLGFEFDLDPENKTYYKLSPITNSQDDLSAEGTSPTTDNDPEQQGGGGPDPTSLFPVTGDVNNPKGDGQGFLNTLEGIVPDLIGTSRLALSLRTNNRVAKTIRPSLKPVLKDTYERYSPITGANSTMQFKNRQGAEVLRLSNQAFTSDASLASARMLEGQRQANQLLTEGFLADDQEIKRTQAEALARQEDNMARRSEVANYNRASINLTNREIAQLEATRLKSNWQSWDNYLLGIEGRLRTKYETDKDRRDTFRLTVAANDVENRYLERIKDATAKVEAWRTANPGVSVTTMPGYRQYEELIKEATRWKNAETYAAHAGIYGYKYDNPYANKNWADTAAQFSFKKGGSLLPSALYLINKVIRNESNT